MAAASTELALAEELVGGTKRPRLRLVQDNERPFLRPLLEGEKAFGEDVVTITTYATEGVITDVRRMVIDWGSDTARLLELERLRFDVSE